MAALLQGATVFVAGETVLPGTRPSECLRPGAWTDMAGSGFHSAMRVTIFRRAADGTVAQPGVTLGPQDWVLVNSTAARIVLRRPVRLPETDNSQLGISANTGLWTSCIADLQGSGNKSLMLIHCVLQAAEHDDLVGRGELFSLQLQQSVAAGSGHVLEHPRTSTRRLCRAGWTSTL